MKAPAILGGEPAFPDGLPFARPFTPAIDAVTARLRPSYDQGQLTNGRLVQELEERAADRLGVDYVVAVSSCTAGLILTLQALDVDGAVLMPSFTFSASAHAVAWNRLRPLLAECDPFSLQLDLTDAEARIDGAGAIMATHVFGAPARPSAVEKLGEARGVPTLFDAAHAFGARHHGRPIGGFGTAEVFSLSPTKTLVAGEGGLVATTDRELAQTLKVARDYGNPGDYDTLFVGLNARMSEFHAAMALESLKLLDEQLALRAAVAARYCAGLQDIPGLAAQEIDPGDTSTYKDFTVIVEPTAFGLSRDQFVQGLRAEGIDTRNYFDPAVHRQRAYAGLAPVSLPVTDEVCRRVTSLPMFARLPLNAVDQVIDRIAALQQSAEEVESALSATPTRPGT
jgi:dTDP-4-amino-4,6-dideoxygalactose transaminase